MAGALWPPGVIVLCWGLTEKMNRPSDFMVFSLARCSPMRPPSWSACMWDYDRCGARERSLMESRFPPPRQVSCHRVLVSPSARRVPFWKHASQRSGRAAGVLFSVQPWACLPLLTCHPASCPVLEGLTATTTRDVKKAQRRCGGERGTWPPILSPGGVGTPLVRPALRNGGSPCVEYLGMVYVANTLYECWNQRVLQSCIILGYSQGTQEEKAFGP